VTPSLRLLNGGSDTPVAPAGSPPLAARPFRPGELPRRLVVDLGDGTAARVREAADRAGVPLGLWLRIAVEAVRHLRAAASLSGLGVDALTEGLDNGAPRPAAPARPVEGSELYAYARNLERGQGGGSTETENTIAIDVSDEIAASWAAAAVGQSLDDWVGSMALEAPRGVVHWEAAAARAGATLGEWVYAAALRAASTSASA
jgi:hypothetical protein